LVSEAGRVLLSRGRVLNFDLWMGDRCSSLQAWNPPVLFRDDFGILLHSIFRLKTYSQDTRDPEWQSNMTVHSNDDNLIARFA